MKNHIYNFEEFNEQSILNRLTKPKANFSCLTLTKKEVYDWYEDYKEHIIDISNYTIYDHEYNYYVNGALFEKKHDKLPDKEFADYIRTKYRFKKNQLVLEEYNNGIGIYVVVPNVDTIVSDLDIDMRSNGYFLSNCQTINGVYKLLFEPLEQSKVNDIVYERQYIYHYTNIKNVENIMKYGLISRNDKNPTYIYPPRVYFTLFHNHGLANSLVKNLREHNISDDGHYMLLKIETEKIKDYADFYYDAFCTNCVFTPYTILPEAISNYLEGYLVGYDKFKIIKEY